MRLAARRRADASIVRVNLMTDDNDPEHPCPECSIVYPREMIRDVCMDVDRTLAAKRMIGL